MVLGMQSIAPIQINAAGCTPPKFTRRATTLADRDPSRRAIWRHAKRGRREDAPRREWSPREARIWKGLGMQGTASLQNSLAAPRRGCAATPWILAFLNLRGGVRTHRVANGRCPLAQLRARVVGRREDTPGATPDPVASQ